MVRVAPTRKNPRTKNIAFIVFHSLVLKSFEVFRLFGYGRLHVQIRTEVAVLVQLQGGVVQLEKKPKTNTYTHICYVCGAHVSRTQWLAAGRKTREE